MAQSFCFLWLEVQKGTRFVCQIWKDSIGFPNPKPPGGNFVCVSVGELVIQIHPWHPSLSVALQDMDSLSLSCKVQTNQLYKLSNIHMTVVVGQQHAQPISV